ncbi:hypothetical protein KC963_01190 [Candidatus Saccharibacteria bacterium]|nr:hypothetical protein [Candidatus Saccharibacteria bacterium]
MLIRNSTNLRRKGIARHTFIVDTPGARGAVWIDATGTVLEAFHPSMAHLRGMNYKELEAYCKTKGWSLAGPIKDYGSKVIT